MGIPQFIVLALMFTGLGIDICKHGQLNKYNGWTSLIALIIMLGLLFWGGFF